MRELRKLLMCSKTTQCNPKRIQDMPDVRPGESHADLEEVQNYLGRYGYFTPEEKSTPGRMDGGTVQALARFQQRFKVGRSGILDAPTREAMSLPRCGLPDTLNPVAFNVIGPWKKRDLRFAFGALSSNVDHDLIRGAISSAFATWADTEVGLTFAEVGATQAPDIVVEFRPSNDPDLSMVGGTLAHADFPPMHSIIADAPPLPIHFDDEEHQWVDGSASGSFDIETVALHEIGHTLGMLHSNVLGAVMFPAMSAGTVLRTLQEDDLAGIHALYPELP